MLDDEDLDLLGKLQLQDSLDALAQQFKPGESLTLNMEADVRPNATLKAYRDLEVEVEAEERSVEDLLEDVLEGQRLSASTTVPLERTTAEMGDVAVLRFSRQPRRKPDEPDEPDDSDEADESDGELSRAPDSRGFDVDLVENHEAMSDIIPLVVGMTVGETKVVPESIDEPGNEDPVDKPTDDPCITLCGLKARRLPELDDAFAQKVSEFATVTEWRDALSRYLEIQGPGEQQGKSPGCPARCSL